MTTDREATGVEVVYDHQVFGSQRFGGISRYFSEIATRIAASDSNKVTVACPLVVNEYLSCADVRCIGVRVPAIRRTATIRVLLNRSLSRLIVPRLAADIFHETYYDTMDRSPRGAKRIVTVFDMIHERFPDSFDPADRTCALKARSVARADHVICISNATKGHLLEILGVPEKKVSVVHLGYLESPAASRAATRDDSSRRPFVLYVGARRGYKNFGSLLEAFRSSQRLRSELSILCFGGGPLTAQERAHAAACGLAPDRLSHAGGSDADLAELYGEAAAFVYPSLEEGFGMPPLEAMAARCPVACSEIPSVSEVVADAAQKFDPKSAEAIASAIEVAAFPGSRREELIRLGSVRAGLFSWDRCASETLAIYRAVAAR